MGFDTRECRGTEVPRWTRSPGWGVGSIPISTTSRSRSNYTTINRTESEASRRITQNHNQTEDRNRRQKSKTESEDRNRRQNQNRRQRNRPHPRLMTFGDDSCRGTEVPRRMVPRSRGAIRSNRKMTPSPDHAPFWGVVLSS